MSKQQQVGQLLINRLRLQGRLGSNLCDDFGSALDMTTEVLNCSRTLLY